MSGATFLGERYGWKWGTPAYLASAYVAYVRVDNGHHHRRDVIASGALAYGVALLTVTPANATHLAPVIGPNFLGLRWQRSF
jgi:membrane-associated phospholipid phosphatase